MTGKGVLMDSRKARAVAPGLMVLLGAALVWVQSVPPGELQANSERAGRRPTGSAQLLSVQTVPGWADGEMCEWIPASAGSRFAALLPEPAEPQAEDAPARRGPAPRPTAAEFAEVNARAPVRMIRDNYPSYSSIGVDLKNDELVMTDESTFSILTYDRLTNTPPTASFSEPKRKIGGHDTWIEYQCGVYIDQESGDIYAVNNDTVDRLVVFSREARGNVPPDRIIHTPHTTYGIAVDEAHQELFLTVQEAAAVSVFRKMAADHEPPLRALQGNRTLLADPHGIAIDPSRDLLFVANFGSVAEHDASIAARGGGDYFSLSEKPNWPLGRESAVPGTGKYLPASITVYPRDAAGDVAPIRVIQGPKTQLNWPTALAIDPKRGEVFVANDTGDSILVFDVTASGDVPPKRVIAGPRSMVKSPTGVFYDWEHDELWVSNFGNHTATVYPATASGDVAPLRVVRSAPSDVGTPNIGNAYAPAYDSKRDQILVPN
jgi:DNA-binding beta-propeller fold protein YncE